jgi:hypothetical protein
MAKRAEVCESADLRFTAAHCKVDVAAEGDRYRGCWTCQTCDQSGSTPDSYGSKDVAMMRAQLLASSHWRHEHVTPCAEMPR